MAVGIPQGPVPGADEPSRTDQAGTPPAPGPPPARAGLTARAGPTARAGWTPGRVIALVTGSVLALVSLGLLAGGGVLMWADQTQRQDGYLTTRAVTYSTSGYALASDRISLRAGWEFLGLFTGQARIRVTSADPASPVFAGIAPAGRVARYLSGARYTTVTRFGSSSVITHPGTAAPAPPVRAGIWTAQAAGTGTRTLTWTADTGDWMVVAMNADGSAGLTVRADIGVSAPWLFRLAVELLVAGLVVGALAAAFIVVPVRLAATRA